MQLLENSRCKQWNFRVKDNIDMVNLTERKRIALLIVIMAFSALMTAVITTAVLYHTAFETQKARLIVSAKARARLMESTARFNIDNNRDYPGGALEATLSQITDAYKNFNSFGKTGELLLAREEERGIVLLMAHGRGEVQAADAVPSGSPFEEPLHRALAGESGAMVVIDYMGKRVLAAYEPVAILNFGLVTKVEMSEIREPFIRAGLIAGGFTLLFVVSGAFLFIRITDPLIKQLEEKVMLFERLNEELEQEITEREYAEDAMRKSENRYCSLFDSMMDAFVSVDMSGSIMETNYSYESMMGYTKEELRNCRYEERTPEKWRAVEERIVKEQILTRGYSDIYQKECRKKDGTLFPVEIRTLLMVDQNQEPAGMWAIVRDITERKAMEEALLENQRKLRRVLEILPVGVWIIERAGTIIYGNRTGHQIWSQICNIGPEEYGEYKAWWAATGEAIRPEDWAGGRALATGEVSSDEEIEAESFDGTRKTLLNWAMPLTDKNGKIEGAVVVNQDITDRKQMEQELNQARLAAESARVVAESANLSKSQFLAVMSHEIRTPMNGIIGLTDLLLTTDITDIQKSYIEPLRYSAYALLDIINDILDISKIEADKLKLAHIEFSIRDVVEKSVFMMSHRASAKGILLRTEIEPDLPEIFIGDPVRIRQIILNLTGNAVKFTEQGEVKVSVCKSDSSYSQERSHQQSKEITLVVASRQQESNSEQQGECKEDGCERLPLNISVQDTGIGIPEDKLATIFESFTQADDFITRKYGGTGLGLAISRRLVEMMSGTISVESEPGRGTIFSVNLKLPVAKLPASLSGESYEKQYGEWPESISQVMSCRLATDSSYTGNILIAEDNIINMMIIRANLAKMGFKIIEASNGKEAVKKFAEHAEIDLVFMDIHMPEMNGFEATHKIRDYEGENKRGHTPIIALTADAFKDDKEKCLAEGMDFYLSKPFSPQDIVNVIKRFLSARVQKAAEESQI